MRKKVERRRTKITITLSPEIVEKIDDNTSNRSHLINWLLKEHFNQIGEDVKNIKL